MTPDPAPPRLVDELGVTEGRSQLQVARVRPAEDLGRAVDLEAYIERQRSKPKSLDEQLAERLGHTPNRAERRRYIKKNTPRRRW